MGGPRSVPAGTLQPLGRERPRLCPPGVRRSLPGPPLRGRVDHDRTREEGGAPADRVHELPSAAEGPLHRPVEDASRTGEPLRDRRRAAGPLKRATANAGSHERGSASWNSLSPKQGEGPAIRTPPSRFPTVPCPRSLLLLPSARKDVPWPRGIFMPGPLLGRARGAGRFLCVTPIITAARSEVVVPWSRIGPVRPRYLPRLTGRLHNEVNFLESPRREVPGIVFLGTRVNRVRNMAEMTARAEAAKAPDPRTPLIEKNDTDCSKILIFGCPQGGTGCRRRAGNRKRRGR